MRVRTIHLCGYCAVCVKFESRTWRVRTRQARLQQFRAFRVNFLKDKVENASFKSAASGFISFLSTFSRTVSAFLCIKRWLQTLSSALSQAVAHVRPLCTPYVLHGYHPSCVALRTWTPLMFP
jgi:hypothetical protein